MSSSCFNVNSGIFFTSHREVAFSNVGSSVTLSSSGLPRLESILPDTWSSMLDNRSSNSNVFLSRPVARCFFSLDGGISTVCWTRSSGSPANTTSLVFRLRVLWLVLSQLPSSSFVLWCVFISRFCVEMTQFLSQLLLLSDITMLVLEFGRSLNGKPLPTISMSTTLVFCKGDQTSEVAKWVLCL